MERDDCTNLLDTLFFGAAASFFPGLQYQSIPFPSDFHNHRTLLSLIGLDAASTILLAHEKEWHALNRLIKIVLIFVTST